MSDNNINNMDVKQLRNEVQLLRDELAIMKRNFEDILYNLDTDNFSQRIVKQGENMYTKIEQTADKIELQAEKVEENEKSIASLEITAGKIESNVKELGAADNTLSSRITQTAESITSEVAARTSADEALSSRITQTANEISSRVESIEDGKIKGYTLFKQTNDTFLFDGEKSVFTGVVYLTDDYGNKRFSFFHTDARGFEEVLIHSCTAERIPIVLGDYEGDVYIGWKADGNEVATRNWVRANGGGSSTAVFA